MDTSLLASHCIELLRTHNRVSLGDMGSFMAEETPATLTRDSHVLMPPGRRISFKESETWNDGLLEQAIGSKDELRDLVSDISKKLAKEKSVNLEGFGKLRKTKEGDVFFVMDKNVPVNPNGFGLVPLSLSPLPVSSKVKCELSESPPAPEVQIQPSVQETKNRPSTGKKEKKWPWVLLTVFVIILLVILMVYIFRDALQPLLEKLLYTPEERLLL
ncbi:MAG: hypothetical protein PHW88_08165 [Bacteroidales bacterium]|nr:hypothetical protein [Bacteroidales bacterium]MDD2771942.1 hypothetical protein [Bacteroidales bacterium]MDD3550409.1 hypothetical protein [Bacteroidales bacterium]MDD4065282.1 hypothetical protein [Bacteroidales bacterium]MDD4500939.1 hypothetical protein [Bacteroidales bacterium]